MNKFAKWMTANDKRQIDVAKKIGISASSLNEIIRQDKIPSIKVAYGIEVYTKGEITIYDWLDEYKRNKTKTVKAREKSNSKK